MTNIVMLSGVKHLGSVHKFIGSWQLDIQNKGGDKKSSSQEVFAIANGIYNLRQDRVAGKEKRCQECDGRISYHTLNKEK